MARPAIFADRDGTLIVERDYLSDPDAVELIPGTAPALARLAAAGFALVVITNQSGIARGLFGEAEFRAVQARLEELLGAEGVALDASYHCPHHPDFTGPCDCRKPALGLYHRAARELDLDLARSVYVGDRLQDVEPARRFGGRALLVRTGYGARDADRVGPGVEIAPDFAAAAARILGPRPAAGS
jgi:D-glycero-D-manno-heptose 1,7-bisphosphate phosphatase